MIKPSIIVIAITSLCFSTVNGAVQVIGTGPAEITRGETFDVTYSITFDNNELISGVGITYTDAYSVNPSPFTVLSFTNLLGGNFDFTFADTGSLSASNIEAYLIDLSFTDTIASATQFWKMSVMVSESAALGPESIGVEFFSTPGSVTSWANQITQDAEIINSFTDFTTEIVAVPEPSQYGAILSIFCCIVLVCFRRRRQQSKL